MNASALTRFDITRIDKLKTLINQEQLEGTNRWYEISVDDLKVVTKTDDISKFDSYQKFVDAQTEKIKVAVYYSLNSPNHKPHYFYPKAEDALAGVLNGPDVQRFIDEKLAAQRTEFEWKQKEQDYQRMQKEQEQKLKETETAYKQKLAQQDDTIAELESEIREYEAIVEEFQAGVSAKSVHWGKMLASGVESFMARNAGRLQRVPLLGSLATAFMPQGTPPLAGSSDAGSEMNFEMAAEEPLLSEEQKRFLELYNELCSELDEQGAQALLNILLIIRRHPQICQDLQQHAVQLAKSKQAAGPADDGSTTILS
jgi:hypothetical protein